MTGLNVRAEAGVTAGRDRFPILYIGERTDMPEPINILALDLATKSGWALGRSDRDRPMFGVKQFSSEGSSPEDVGKALFVWLSDMTRIEKVGAVYIERPMPPGVASKIGTTPQTNFILVGLPFLAGSIARCRNIPIIRYVDAQTAKSFFLGQRTFRSEVDPVTGKTTKSRQVGKRAAIARCRQIGLDVRDDNEADAVSLWYYAVAQHNPMTAHVVTPLFAGATNG